MVFPTGMRVRGRVRGFGVGFGGRVLFFIFNIWFFWARARVIRITWIAKRSFRCAKTAAIDCFGGSWWIVVVDRDGGSWF